jgi:hypothetical protein
LKDDLDLAILRCLALPEVLVGIGPHQFVLDEGASDCVDGDRLFSGRPRASTRS